MNRTTLSLALLGAILSCFPPGAAYAQIQRTWVASFGSDANNCSRAQPCATFTRAVSPRRWRAVRSIASTRVISGKSVLLNR